MNATAHPRHLTAHLAGPDSLPLVIATGDQPGAGGAHQRYDITGFGLGRNPSSGRPHAEFLLARDYTGSNVEVQQHYRNVLDRQDVLTILFQNGNPADVGCNGVTIEALLTVAIDRLQGCQDGPFANEHNAAALVYLRSAIEVLHMRSRERAKELAG